MADLSTTYLGLNLSSPLVLAASPIANTRTSLRIAAESGGCGSGPLAV